MAAVQQHAVQLPTSRVHFEYFSAPANTGDEAPAAGSFKVELKRSNMTLLVPRILEVSEAHGIALPFSCREGLCRTCETVVCEGEVEHRDYVLSQEERDAGRSMMICVSRAKSPALVLDL